MYYVTRVPRVLIGTLVLAWFGVAIVAHAGTVENYVSVEATSDNGGTSVVHSQTIVNGRVVENVTRTGTGSVEYQQSSYYPDGQTMVTADATTSVATTTAAARATLLDLVTRLRHYVALLTQLLATTVTH